MMIGEAVLYFPPECIHLVAEMAGAKKKRRRATEQEKAILAEGRKKGFEALKKGGFLLAQSRKKPQDEAIPTQARGEATVFIECGSAENAAYNQSRCSWATRRLTMPYADPERRRAFHRAYKRRRRAEQANPLAAFKVYVCPRFPSLGVGLDRFDGGFLITDRPDVQAQVERHPEYGRFIFPLALDLNNIYKEKEEDK